MKKRVILLVMVLSVFSALISVNAQTIKTFEVTNTDDSGPGSLRAAVEAANISTADSNRIVFAFEESGSHVINIDTTIILNASHTAIDGSTTKDSVIIEGKGEDFDGILVPLYGGHSLTNVYLNKINVRNCSGGVVFLGTCGVVIENCAFMYNYIGVELNSACVFRNTVNPNSGSFGYAISNHVNYCDILNCHFYYNGYAYSRDSGNEDQFYTKFSNSTFEKNHSVIGDHGNNLLYIENCSFVDNLIFGNFHDDFKENHAYFINNTYVGKSFCYGDYYDLSNKAISTIDFKGNVFYVDNFINSDRDLESHAITSSNNIYLKVPNSEIWKLGDSDILYDNADWSTFLDGTYSQNVFTPILKLNGGFTPTVALKSDRLPNGQSIRFPLTETTVTADQRGVARLENTCMGAYELDSVSRDSVVYLFKDTICQGATYEGHGFTINTTDSVAGDYRYEKSISSFSTDTVYAVNLHVKHQIHLDVVDLEFSPSVCLDGHYGGVDFTLWGNVDSSLIKVELLDSLGNLATQGFGGNTDSFNSEYEKISFHGHFPGKHTVKVYGSGCVADTSFEVDIPNADTIKVFGLDTLYTSCLTAPNASAVLEVHGYHPSASFGVNEDGIPLYNYRNGNYYTERSDVDYIAYLHLDSLAVGHYVVKGSDMCGHRYDSLFAFDVVGPKALDLQLLSSKSQLKCGEDHDAYVELQFTGGNPNSFLSVTGNKRNDIYRATGDTTTVMVENLSKGSYLFNYLSGDANCPDNDSLRFDMTGPDSLKVDLLVHGVVCEDAVISATITGESGQYNIAWVNPAGDTIRNNSQILSNVGAGSYQCIVNDEEGCATVKDQAFVSPLEGLSRLRILSVHSDETCFGSDNARIVVLYYNNNLKQAVTCTLTDMATGTVVRSVVSKLQYKLITFNNVKAGTYEVRLRYGTPDCNLGLDEVTRTFELKAKAKPLTFGTPVVKPSTCFSVPNGSVDLQVSGWEGHYTAKLGDLSVKPDSVSADSIAYFHVKSVLGGDYRFVVNDDCKTDEAEIDIHVDGAAKPNSITVVDGSKEPMACAKDKNGFVVLNVSGGNIGVDSLYCLETQEAYLVNAEGQMTIDGLYGGVYHFEYRSQDETCPSVAYDGYEILAPETLKTVITVSDFGCEYGLINMKASGESGEFNYKWTDADNNYISNRISVPLKDLKNGETYYCEVSDQTGCDTKTDSIRIPKLEELPTLIVTAGTKGESCYQGNNARIWTHVKVAQQMQFSIDVTYSVKNLETGELCFINSNPLTTEVNDYTPAVLAPGTYEISARYGSADCDMGLPPVSYNLEVEAMHKIEFTATPVVKPVTCYNEPNGSVSVKMDGWNTNNKISLTKRTLHSTRILFFFIVRYYSYDEVESSIRISPEGQTATINLSNLSVGDYRLKVSDACGNSSSMIDFSMTSVAQPLKIEALSKKTDLKCNYSTDGFVELSLKGANPAGTQFYKFHEPSVTVTKDTIVKFEGLGAGYHDFHLRSIIEGCSDHTSFDMTVAPASPMETPISVVGEPCVNQTLNATPTGGALPYSLVWKNSNGVEVAKNKTELAGVGTGSFYYELDDANGCHYESDSLKAVLIDKENLTLTLDTAYSVETKCAVSEDGYLAVIYSGNKGESKISAKVMAGSEEVGTATFSNKESDTITVQSLAKGKYEISLVFADAAECSLGSDYLKTVVVETPDTLKATISPVAIICDTLKGGKAIVSISGGYPPYQCQWMSVANDSIDSHQTRQVDTLSGLRLDASVYCVVSDSNGCELTTDPVEVKMLNVTELTVTEFDYSETVRCHGVDNAFVSMKLGKHDSRVPVQITAVRQSDNKEFTYSIPGEESEGAIETLGPGVYNVGLAYEDGGACLPVFDTVIKIDSLKELAMSDVDMKHQVSCHNPANGAISFTVDGWAKSHFAGVFYDKDTLQLFPDSVVNQLAYFSPDTLLGGDSVFVRDICENKVQKETSLEPFEDYQIDVIDAKLKLKCSYSTDGFVEIKVSGGLKDSNVVYANVKGADTLTIRSSSDSTILYSNLGVKTYNFIYKSSVVGCKDSVSVSRTVEAPQPIEFLTGVNPSACYDIRSGEFSVVPHRGGSEVLYVSPDSSKNYSVELKKYLKKEGGATSPAFPEIIDMNLTAKSQIQDTLLSVLEVSLSDSTAKNIAKKFPVKKIWKMKNGIYKYPEKWIGYESLPADVYYFTVTDDSSCVFVDTINIIDPTYKTLNLDSVKYNHDDAICHAENRYAEVYVSGGWGKYLYSFNMQDKAPSDTSGVPSQTYISGDSTSRWKQGDMAYGYYRSAILKPGKYRVAVIDSFGCKDSLEEILNVDAHILVDGVAETDSCGGQESTITVTPKVVDPYQPYPPYKYAIRYEDTHIGDTIEGLSVDMVLKNIPIGTIGVFAMDEKGCSGYSTFDVFADTAFVPFTTYMLGTKAVSCKGDTDGEVLIQTFGAYPPYMAFNDTINEVGTTHDKYLNVDKNLNNLDTVTIVAGKGVRLSLEDTICLFGLKGGAHELTIIDSIGCKTKVSFNVPEPAELYIEAQGSVACSETDNTGKIFAKQTSGGVPPYQYSLDNVNFFSNDHLPSAYLVPSFMYVRDTNGCVMKSEDQAMVKGTIKWDSINAGCLVTTWHDFDDVVAFVDISQVPESSEGTYDSTKIILKPHYEEFTDEHVEDSIEFEELNRTLYTYGIPDTSDYIILWNKDTIKGPLWGIPEDIAAGMKSDSLFNVEKTAIENLEKAYTISFNKNKGTANSDTIAKLKRDSTIIANRKRVNCTESMITSTFKPIMGGADAKRLCFFKFKSSTTNLSELMKKSKQKDNNIFLRYDYTHILYVSGCDLTTQYDSILIATEGYRPYEELDQRDILGLSVYPNPVAEDQTVTIQLTLSEQVPFAINVYTLIGTNDSKYEIKGDLAPSIEIQDDKTVYVYSISDIKISQNSAIMVTTAKDKESTVVLYTGTVAPSND